MTKMSPLDDPIARALQALSPKADCAIDASYSTLASVALSEAQEALCQRDFAKAQLAAYAALLTLEFLERRQSGPLAFSTAERFGPRRAPPHADQREEAMVPVARAAAGGK
jgi:hypothetical protein